MPALFPEDVPQRHSMGNQSGEIVTHRLPTDISVNVYSVFAGDEQDFRLMPPHGYHIWSFADAD